MQVNIGEQSEELLSIKQRFGIIGNSPALIRALSRAIKVAPIDLSVLVTGESGSGKEFFPKIIHALSPRKHAKYIAVNCGAIPEGTIDSELFGHEKGAFTGAVAARKGYFEEADGGTIFLDEVAELPLTTQARLLRVLESGEYMRVGSSAVMRTNIRIVAATNVDMLKAVEQGKFREDLYYRLSTVSISVPPLRDRGNDLRLLARKFAADFAERYMMPRISFDDDAEALMMRYRWPGNVRQLKNVVEQLALFDAGNAVTAESLAGHLPDIAADYTPTLPDEDTLHTYARERELLFNMIVGLQHEVAELRARLDGGVATRPAPHGDRQPLLLSCPTQPDHHDRHDDNAHLSPKVIDTIAVDLGHNTPSKPTADTAPTLKQMEIDAIRESLLHNDGNRKAAAAALGISERTLYRKINEYGIE